MTRLTRETPEAEMAKFEQRVRVAYFGYSAEFTTAENRNGAIRAEANRIVLAKFGSAPDLRYVEPGIPFPDYVPIQRYDHEDDGFY